MRGQLHVVLQRTLDFVAFGLVSAGQATEPATPVFARPDGGPPMPPLNLPGAAFTIALARGMTFTDARERFTPWLLGCGLRDCIEAVSLYLDEVRRAAALFVAGGKMSGTDWNRTVNPRGQASIRFHMLGLKDKMGALTKRYDASLHTAYDEAILTIQQARNCLVHRLGIVGAQDVKGDPLTLRVTWRRNEFLIRDEGSGIERPMPSIPFDVEGPAEILVRPNVPTEKSFALGTRVEFTAQEFSEVVFTCFLYASDLRDRCLALAKAKGVADVPKRDAAR